MLVDHEARGNVHRLEFLAEEFEGVWDVDLGDLGLVAAGLALKGAFAEIGHGHHATEVADKDAVRIRNIKETFLQDGISKRVR